MAEWIVRVTREIRMHAGDEPTARFLLRETPLISADETVDSVTEIPPTSGTYETDGTVGPV